MKNCKICGDKTKAVYNINLKAVPICEGCADSIMLQQTVWYSQERIKKEKS